MTRWNAMLLASILMCGLSTTAARPSSPPPAPLDSAGSHGGQIYLAGDFQCEVIFSMKSLQVYVYDRSGLPVATKNVRGRVTYALPGDPRTYRYDLYPQAGDGTPSNALYLAIDPSRVPDRAATVDIALHGLAQRRVAIAARFQGSPPRVQLAHFTRPVLVKATKADAAAIAHQETCPVMDEPLHAMGGPWKTSLQGRTVFICCQGCVTSLRNEPQKYLAKLPEPLPVKATPVDAVAVQRQRVCPVMKGPLNAMGGPWRVTVKGQSVYVCCKGCVPKVQADPDQYIRRVATARSAGSQPLRR